MKRLAFVAMMGLAGCAAEIEPAVAPPVEEQPIAPVALPSCSARDGSSCSAPGHAFACDNGRWHPPGRVGRSGICVCDGRTHTCG